jgi:hypothetical protein
MKDASEEYVDLGRQSCELQMKSAGQDDVVGIHSSDEFTTCLPKQVVQRTSYA